MPRLLHIQSSPNLMQSVTRQLSTEFVQNWLASHPGTEVEVLDLATEPLPHFGMDNFGAMMAPPDQQTPAMKAAAALSDRLISQLERADVVVIGSPMYNFTICTQLKAWFDHVTIAGRTFKYTAPGVAKGLLFGKKVFVVEARGGDYADPPISAFDFQETLTRMLLLFIGLFDTHFIRAEGMRQKPEDADFIVKHAKETIARLAA